MMAMLRSLAAARRIASGFDAGMGVLAVHDHVLSPLGMAFSLPQRVTHKDRHKQDHRGKAGQRAGQDKGKQAVVARVKIDGKTDREHRKARTTQAHLQPAQGAGILRRATMVKAVQHHGDPPQQVHMRVRGGKAEVLGHAHVNAKRHARRSGNGRRDKAKIRHLHNLDLSMRPNAPRQPAGGQYMRVPTCPAPTGAQHPRAGTAMARLLWRDEQGVASPM
jgi:hypothetical protein